MYRWMVAIDGSENAREAFYTALSLMDKRRDELFIVTTVQTSPLPLGGYQRYSEEIECMYKQYLVDYANRCEEQGVKHYKVILARGRHIGDMICKAAEKKGVDFLILGRRGMNRLSRMMVGSTSKYCMEKACCNVLVTKGWYLPEDHVSLYETKQLEEQERERRIRALGKPEEHYGSRDDARKLEEDERKRRLREQEEEATVAHRAEREAELIRQLKELDDERARRGEQSAGRLIDRISRLEGRE